jgi:hypothetical protein
MADYYPVLARAVAKLPSEDARARRELYAHARAVVGKQLRGGPDSAVEILREQAALEAAIGRIEAETRAHPRINGKAAVPGASRRSAIVAAEPRAETTARSLSKILQAVQSDEASVGDELSPRRALNNPIRSSAFGQAPNSVATMLFGLSYVVAALAFAGVTYIRCAVWVYQGVIGYPVLLGVMALTLGLFIVPPLAIFRKASSLPTIDSVWRFIYGRSRGLL